MVSNSYQRCQRSDDLIAHQHLVKKIARRIRARLPASVGLDELEQAGLMGLNEALSRYEEGKGSTFETYAARRIEGSMLDALRAMDTLSRDARARIRQVREAVQRLEHRLGRPPRAVEVANELDWPLHTFHACMEEAGFGAVRGGHDDELDHPHLDTDAVACPGDGLHDEHADPLTQLQLRQRNAALNAAFDALEQAERYVMECIYRDDMTLAQIGETLGVSESRVSRMSAEIVAKLKRRLRAW